MAEEGEGSKGLDTLDVQLSTCARTRQIRSPNGAIDRGASSANVEALY